MKKESHHQRFDKDFSSFDCRKQEQHITVMRHGDRLDCEDPLWKSTAERPWDPPLSDTGKARAFAIGKQFKDNLSAPIHRVIVSPFLRCVQTASQIVSALCTVDKNANYMDVGNEVKVTIEYGLCEVFNRRNLARAPEHGKNVGFNVSELEAMFPDGTVETMEPICNQLPDWHERPESAKLRYATVIRSLAKRFPYENLLLVTHKMGVKTAVSSFRKDKYVYDVDYCGYSHLKRRIFRSPNKKYLFTGVYDVTTKSGESGVKFCPLIDKALYKKEVTKEQPVGFIQAWRIPGVAPYALCIFFAKLVAYTFFYWLPFYISHTGTSTILIIEEDDSILIEKERVLTPSPLPQIPISSPPLQPQTTLEVERSKKRSLAIVDYGHDETAMSPEHEAEEGEIMSSGQWACDGWGGY
ncbi:hypothetical protein IFM89_027386 [Coptis chinensis]|uniref:Phosphoglycerate mutase family protein n=1 Tax=Coptis chinensis TaxID=261450 RepID=A0A835H5V5_9MAGN|nr:hypothetical protein IFM89_027386 [Coptis chinensis]